jgi:Collagen triple helix repeat (20 copies)
MRRYLSYPYVTATLALFFAMSGGALAARHYLISSTGQISPKVLNSLKGKTGPHGPAGARGATGNEGPRGKDGATGKEGPQGKEGSPAQVLASGQTEVGAYSAWGPGGGFIGASENFRIPLSSSLDSSHVHLIAEGGSATAECPGSHTKPEAASGNLCVYESRHQNAASGEITPPSTGVVHGADPYGFQIAFTSAKALEAAWDFGTWAVTG